MANLDFGSIATTQVEATGTNHLRAWNIYENVKFDGVGEKVTGTGAHGDWAAWDFNFSCPEGIYTERIFDPTLSEHGMDRGEFPGSNGGTVQTPSNFEKAKCFCTQLVGVFAPDKLESYRVACSSGKLKSFEQFVKLTAKTLEDSTVTTNLKLGGRKSGDSTYAALSNYARINNTTKECFTSDNFVGEKVAFTNWEKKQKEAYENHKPTDMPKSVDPLDAPEETSSSDESINDLLKGL